MPLWALPVGSPLLSANQSQLSYGCSALQCAATSQLATMVQCGLPPKGGAQMYLLSLVCCVSLAL